MLQSFACLTTEHDGRIVALAVAICFLSSLVAISLFHRIHVAAGPTRWIWLGLTAVATGYGVWATHFIAILAYQASLDARYQLFLTIISLFLAILVTGVGLIIAQGKLGGWRAAAGGAVVGLGIAVMHFSGMAALDLPGHVTWVPSLVFAAIALGIVFGSLTLVVAAKRNLWRASLAAAVLFTLAVLLTHFTGMAAMRFVPDPTRDVNSTSLLPESLTALVASLAAIILGMCLFMALSDRQYQDKLRRQKLLLDATPISEHPPTMILKLSSEPDERILSMLRRAEPLVLGSIAAIAILVLGAWFIPGLATHAPPGWSKMVANTSVCLIIAAGSLALSAEHQSPLRIYLSQAAGVAVLAFGALTLVEYIVGISFGFDTWLPHGHSKGTFPGRASLQTAIGFVLLGFSLLTIRENKNPLSLFADLAAGMLVALDLVMIGGYLYGAQSVIGIDQTTLMSPHTLACFSAATFVIVGRRAKQGRMFADLVGIGIGSQTVRIVLPAVIVLPFAFFVLVGGLIDSGTTTGALARTVAAPAETVLFLGIIVWMAWQINGLERQLRELSLTDELTKVYNRRGFYFLAEQALRNAARTDAGMTVLFFDLDGLKRANDTLGHEGGSKLIQGLARILVESFRESDIIGRVGGDEFAVLTTGDGGQARKALARVVVSMDDYNKFSASSAPLSFSVGLAEFAHGSAESLDGLVARADAAMYQDKATRKAGRSAVISG